MIMIYVCEQGDGPSHMKPQDKQIYPLCKPDLIKCTARTVCCI